MPGDYEMKNEIAKRDSGNVLFETGRAYLFSLIGGIFVVGRVARVSKTFVKVSGASFVKGMLARAVVDGQLQETQPCGDVSINIPSIGMVFPWRHVLPKVPWSGK